MFPYLDAPGFRRRTTMTSGEVDYLVTDSPGYIEQKIAMWSSYINGRLRKRYGNGTNQNGMVGNALPFGQTAPLLVAAGTSPPSVTLTGRPVLGSLQIVLNITTPGGLGVAMFRYTLDGGVTYTTGIVTAASVALGTSGVTANFPNATYAADNQYAAAPPVPEIVLQWLTVLVTYDCYLRRGVNPQDPIQQDRKALVEEAKVEIKEAAHSKDGLFDLPVSEDLDSAVTTGGPLGYSDASPYGWQVRQAQRGSTQDQNDFDGQGAVSPPVEVP